MQDIEAALNDYSGFDESDLRSSLVLSPYVSQRQLLHDMISKTFSSSISGPSSSLSVPLSVSVSRQEEDTEYEK